MRLEFYLGHYNPAYRHYSEPLTGKLPSSGPSTAVRGLTQALARAGHDVSIVAQGRETIDFNDGPVAVRVFRKSDSKMPFSVSRDLLAYVRDSARVQDAIVLNNIFFTDLAPISRVARQAGLPYIVSTHAPYHPAIFRNHRIRKQLYWYGIERGLLQRSAAVQMLASAHLRHLETLGIESLGITVPNGFEPEMLHAPISPRPNHETVTIGYLGRIDSWHKGLDFLLDGFALSRKRFPALHLVLQGPDWGDGARLKMHAARLGISDAVQFREPEDAASSTVISGWDALIAPSRYDGFPLTVVEAMLARRPVICSTEAGVIEHVERAGCGIRMHPDAHGVADGISRLMAMRDEWPLMGDAGYDYAIPNLNWDKIAQQATHAYETVLAPPTTYQMVSSGSQPSMVAAMTDTSAAAISLLDRRP